jgi:predicted phage tail protein
MSQNSQSAAHRAYVSSELKKGRAAEDIRADLLGRGVLDQTADGLIREAKTTNRRFGFRKGILYLAIGIVCSVLGTAITAGTYSSAAQSGGTYLVTIGLFGFGIGYTLGGIIRLIVAATKGR